MHVNPLGMVSPRNGMMTLITIDWKVL